MNRKLNTDYFNGKVDICFDSISQQTTMSKFQSDFPRTRKDEEVRSSLFEI
jgi:hypothetical protein